MITTRDFVRLPFTTELAEAGVTYARRAFSSHPLRAGLRAYDAVRRVAASAALGLAFRRYLSAQEVAFAVQLPPPFLDPDRYDLRLGDRNCELKTYLIARRAEWMALSQDPQLILDTPVLVPLDRHVAETLRPDDVYIFGFAGAAVMERPQPGKSVDTTGGEFWLHFLPAAWRRPQGNAPLGPLALKTADAGDITIDLDGVDASGAPTVHRVPVPGRRRQRVANSLVALSHVGVGSRPTGRMGISAPARQLTHVIEPEDWHNIWLQGWGLIVVGWMTRQEFRTRATLLPVGRSVLQFDRTRLKNLAVSVAHLKPLATLPGIK